MQESPIFLWSGPNLQKEGHETTSTSSLLHRTQMLSKFFSWKKVRGSLKQGGISGNHSLLHLQNFWTWFKLTCLTQIKITYHIMWIPIPVFSSPKETKLLWNKDWRTSIHILCHRTSCLLKQFLNVSTACPKYFLFTSGYVNCMLLQVLHEDTTHSICNMKIQLILFVIYIYIYVTY